jgi:phosphoenolpyruvate carboxykinase (GTP)
VRQWVDDVARLTRPERVVVLDGSREEAEGLAARLVEVGTLRPLDPSRRPGSYLARSDPRDVARVEDHTFICSSDPADAGPTNNWRDPVETRAHLTELFDGSMRGRTMYVIPFSMGPVGGPLSRLGVQLTDSAYVALSMGIMTRMGRPALEALGAEGEFVPCLHSVGRPLDAGAPDVPWPCHPDEVWIAHFPETREIWSYGSGYGGNALLGKKCLALRIASVIARDEGWLAEHMLIVKVTSPRGEVHYMAGAFPSACGKTNLAMLVPTRPGWRVETIGDDICWMRPGPDGRLWAMNPEAGYFGVAPGTGPTTNPHAIQALSHDAIFTNTALGEDGDVWWEGLTDEPPSRLLDWRGEEWTPASGRPAAHPNARFTVAAVQNPALAAEWEAPEGVPLSATLLGGRRQGVVPLVAEARSWQHGVFLGAIMGSETTAAATGTTGRLRRDPFAMLPFCGYHMGDYFAHWLSMADRTDPRRLPRLYLVNWFRRDASGRFLWPGFGENIRVLEWIVDRLADRADAVETPIGWVPPIDGLPREGLAVTDADLAELCRVDPEEWRAEAALIHDHLVTFGDRLPAALAEELDDLCARLGGPT